MKYFSLVTTLEELKKEYRKLCFELHPDRNHDKDTTQEFQQMQNEYEKLITKVLKLQDRKKEILKHNAEMVEQNTTMNQLKQYFQEIGEMKEFEENICKIMLKEIIVMNRNKLIYKFRNGYTADIEVFDNYLVKDDIGEVKIYASTEC